MNTRRSFIHTAVAAIVPHPLVAAPSGKRKNTLCAFTKHFQGISFDQIADIAAELGLDGIEAPIRPGGHVEPERVAEDLPKLHEALKKRGLEITIMTSGLNAVNKEQNTEQVLRTAAACGVKRFRCSYLKYDLGKPIYPQLQTWKPQLRDLVQLAKEIGVQPLWQNHSGKDYLGAPIWDVHEIMRAFEPEAFAFAFDIYHATVEGGSSWPLEAALAADRLGAVYMKDFKWNGRKAEGGPLGEGQVSPDFAKWLVKQNYAGPVSLHVEYLKGEATDPANLKLLVDAHKRDLAVLKRWMGWE